MRFIGSTARRTGVARRFRLRVSPPSPAIRWLSGYETVTIGSHGDCGTVERGVDVTTTIAASPLTATDRCDRCGAQAYVRATMESGFDLLLCGHHWRENESRLREIAVSIQDESIKLTDVPAVAPLEER